MGSSPFFGIRRLFIMAPERSRYRRFEAESSQPTSTNRLLIALFVFSLLLSLPLAINIVGRIQAEAKMRGEFDRLTSEVNRGEKCVSELDSAVEYAKSDAYTERWAREQERLGKEGEVVIVPASSGNSVQPARPWWEQQVDCSSK
jgi:hypothetical protein